MIRPWPVRPVFRGRVYLRWGPAAERPGRLNGSGAASEAASPEVPPGLQKARPFRRQGRRRRRELRQEAGWSLAGLGRAFAW